MDFEAVRDSSHSSLRFFNDPANSAYGSRRDLRAILPDTCRAFEYLSTARNVILDEAVINTWYLRNPVEAALTDCWLTKGDLAEARVQAKRFLEFALTTPNHPYQSLAWEANARVAVAEGNLKDAQDCIAKTLATMEGFEVPPGRLAGSCNRSSRADRKQETGEAPS
jgi:hypothetical protein